MNTTEKILSSKISGEKVDKVEINYDLPHIETNNARAGRLTGLIQESVKNKNLSHILLCILCIVISFDIYAQDSVRTVREDIEWLDIWAPHTNDRQLPRILLIGNSITRAYHKEVEALLKDKAYVVRLSTSKSIGDAGLLAEISLIMSDYSFDVVHFNNGLHGWEYSEAEYKNAFHDFFETIREKAPDAKYIWATSTPVFNIASDAVSLDPRTDRIKARNKIAGDYFSGKNVVINDLFSLAVNHPEYYSGSDGVHLVKAGVTALANQVATEISKALEKVSK
jgi:lysophospholipase L1-like esterase